MKIAVLVNELDIRGGTHKQVLRLCQYLRSKCDITIYTFVCDLDKTYPEFKSFKIVVLDNSCDDCKNDRFINKLKPFKKLRKQYALLQLIDKDTDIINIHDNGFCGLMFLSKFIRNHKLVWQINDLPGLFCVGASKNEKNNSLSAKRKRFFYKYVASKVDKITVNVTKNKERVEECLGTEASVLYCGVDVNSNLLKHRYRFEGNSNDVVNILSSGVFYRYRNYETLVEVVDLLRKDGINAYLRIIGSTADKQYTNEIRKIISRKGLNKYIDICGQVDEFDYNRLHNISDVFAFINIDQSWGLAVFEAMSCGLPVIVSDSVGATEILNDKVDSIFVNPLDANEIKNKIKLLTIDENYYNNISQEAIKVTNDCSWDKMYSSKMLEIFTSIKG